MSPRQRRTASLRLVGIALGAGACLAAEAAAQATWLKVLPSPGEGGGDSVAAIGDLNGDGRADFVVGYPQADGPSINAGLARVLSGLDGSVLRSVQGTNENASLGTAVAGGGDVDGDGFPDFVAGGIGMSPGSGNQGGIRVVSGATGAVLYTAYGNAANDMLGLTVAFVGDLDGDGIQEVAAGAPYADPSVSDAGIVRVYEGPAGAVLATLNGTHVQGSLGRSLAGIGDASGDGIDDLAAGAPFATVGVTAVGVVRVVSLASGTPVDHLVLTGTPSMQSLGNALAAGGDFDDDGRGDLLVANWPGTVRMLSGADGAPLQTYTVGPTTFGVTVALAGDFDGTGDADVVIGAPFTDVSGLDDAGAAFVFDGSTAVLRQTYLGTSWVQNAGRSVAGIGDASGDGRGDVVVGRGSFGGIASVFAGLVPSCVNASGSVDLNVDGVPDVCQTCQSNLAAGGPGNMHLQICGDPLTFAGSKTSLGVSKGTPGVSVFLLASTSSNPTPAFGGTIWPFPVVAIVPGAFDAEGSWKLVIPGGPGGPVNVYLQAIAPWPGGSKPYEISGPTLLALGF